MNKPKKLLNYRKLGMLLKKEIGDFTQLQFISFYTDHSLENRSDNAIGIVKELSKLARGLNVKSIGLTYRNDEYSHELRITAFDNALNQEAQGVDVMLGYFELGVHKLIKLVAQEKKEAANEPK